MRETICKRQDSIVYIHLHTRARARTHTHTHTHTIQLNEHTVKSNFNNN